MRVKTRFFASARDAVGHRELDLEVPTDTTAGALLERLISDYPKLAGHAKTLRMAVNEAYTDLSHPLNEGDEVALIPPVSGG